MSCQTKCKSNEDTRERKKVLGMRVHNVDLFMNWLQTKSQISINLDMCNEMDTANTVITCIGIGVIELDEFTPHIKSYIILLGIFHAWMI